jgi:hypothetical protein
MMAWGRDDFHKKCDTCGVESSAFSEAPAEKVLDEVDQFAWRALALSQESHEKFGAPLAPGAK